MPINSRAKGVRGELEAAAALRRIHIEASRSQQYSGKGDAADLTCANALLHVEVKLRDTLSPYKFIEQAVTDCKPATGRKPCVLMRSTYKPMLFMCLLDDLPFIAREVVNAQPLQPHDHQCEAL